MYRGGGAPQAPPRLHRNILRWQNHVKAKIVHVADKIFRVMAVIASEEVKICLSKSSYISFWNFLVFFLFSMVKIHFFQKVLKDSQVSERLLLYIFRLQGGWLPNPKVENSTLFFSFFNPFLTLTFINFSINPRFYSLVKQLNNMSSSFNV